MKHLFATAGMIQAAGIATQGVDLFIGTIPADVEEGVMLRDPLTGIPIDKGMQDFYSFEFQVIIRDPDVQAGYARAEAIQAACTVYDWSNDDIQISWLEPVTKPATYPRGDADTLETSFRMRIGFGEK